MYLYMQHRNWRTECCKAQALTENQAMYRQPGYNSTWPSVKMNKDDQDARLRQMSRPEEMQTDVGCDVHMEEDPRFREKTNLSIIERAMLAGNRLQGLRLQKQHQIRPLGRIMRSRNLPTSRCPAQYTPKAVLHHYSPYELSWWSLGPRCGHIALRHLWPIRFFLKF